MDDEKFMRVAINEAQISLSKGVLPVGAVIVENNAIIAQAHKNGDDFHLGHAELMAMEKVFKNKRIERGRSFSLYTTIEPCVMCFGAILHCSVIERVIYALEDPWGGAASLKGENLRERHHKKWPEIRSGVFREEVRLMAKKFLTTTDDPYWNDEKNVFVKTIKQT